MAAPSAESEAPSGSALSTVKPVAPNGWTRRDRPCDACRRRKSRCILLEGADSCVLCHSRSEECTFVQIPQRRKRRRDEESSEGASNPRQVSSPEAKQNINGKQVILDYSSLQGPTLLKKTLGLQNRQHGQYLGVTTEYDPRLTKRGGRIGEGLLRCVSPASHFVLFNDHAAEVDAEISDLDSIESIVAPHGRALVDLYFRIVHPSFPILHKKVFLEKYARTYREFTPPVLAAVYILALNWWSYSPDLVSLPKPDVQALEKLVAKTMGDVLDRPKFSNVQAGLLLLQRPEGDSWALTGQLVAVGQNLGLHLDCSGWNIPSWERGLRKRLAWGLFMQDKWGALIHGRPSHITRDNWIVKPVETADFPETAKDDDDEEGSSDVEKGRLSFIHMISLTEILSDILDQFFSLRASLEPHLETSAQLEKAKPLQIRLKEWYLKLPACLALGETKARKLSSTGYLHLAYFATEVTLHRAILSSLPLLTPSITTSQLHLRTITRAAAHSRLISAINFTASLTPAHLQSFWYFASKVNLAIIGTFGAVLWATSDNFEEAEGYKSILGEYRWTLRVSSKGAEFMQFTVGLLDACVVFARDGESVPGTVKPDPEAEMQEKDQNNDDDGEDAGNGNGMGEESRHHAQELSSAQPTPPFYGHYDAGSFNAGMAMQGVQASRDGQSQGPDIYQFSGSGNGAGTGVAGAGHGGGGPGWGNFNPPEAFMTGASDWSLGDFNYDYNLPGSGGGEYDHNEANFAEF